jgi:DNA-binding beta-propeller fold protein YncE
MRRSNSSITIPVASLVVAQAAGAAPDVYIPLGETGRIQVVNAASGRTRGFIVELSNVHGLAITPDRRLLVVGSYVEVEAGADPSPPRPATVSKAEHEKYHALTAAAPATGKESHVSIVDAASRKVTRRISLRGAVHHVAVSPDGRYAVTTHPGAGGISVIDLRTFGVTATVQTGPAPNYAVFTSDGQRLYVSNTGTANVSEISTDSWAVARSISTGRGPEHVVLSPDDGTLYVNNAADGTVLVVSLDEGRATRTHSVGKSPHGIDLSHDGASPFVSSKGDNRLVAVDLATGTQRRLQLTPAPYHVTTVSGSGKVYVSSRTEQRIWVIDQRKLSLQDQIHIGGIGHQMVVAER